MITSETYRQFKLCIFPWKIAAGVTSTSAFNTKNAVNSVMEILKDEKQIVLTHCYYKSEIPMAYQEISMNTAFLRGISQNEAWAKTNPFSKPEPNSKLIIQKGKEIAAAIRNTKTLVPIHGFFMAFSLHKYLTIISEGGRRR
jgi:hypothetical protein